MRSLVPDPYTGSPTPRGVSDGYVLDMTVPLDEPFSENTSLGGLTQVDAAMVVVADKAYLIDTKGGKYRRSSENIVGQRDARAGEAATTQTDIYRRTFESWHLGAGQTFTDRDGSNQYQFVASKGVNPWEQYQLTLLNDTLLDAAGVDPLVAVVGPRMAVADGVALTWSDGPGDIAPVAEVLPSAAVSLVSDGRQAVALGADGTVIRKQEGSAAVVTSAPSGVFSVVGAVKGRILAGAGPTLYDLTSGTAEAVWQHPDASWLWSVIGDGLTAVYAGGAIGDKSHIYRFRSKEDGTGLDVGVQASALPDGETATHIGYYLGYSVVGTSRGVRFGSSDSQGNIVLGRLIETPFPVLCSEGQGSYIWFGWSGFDAGASGLGRMDPSKFTDPLTPAYASDLMAYALGDVTSVATVGGRRVFTVEGSGVWAEAGDLVPFGNLDSGMSSWNTPDLKRGAYLMVRHAPLEGVVRVDASFDAASEWEIVGTSQAQGSSASPNLTLQGRGFSAINVRALLVRSETDATSGPLVTRLECRAIPTSGRASVFQVPLVITERMEWYGSTETRDCAMDVNDLVVLCETGQPIVYREGSAAWEATMIDYEWMPERLTSDGRGWSGVFLAVLRELK